MAKTVQEVKEWLTDNGFQDYCQKFEGKSLTTSRAQTW